MGRFSLLAARLLAHPRSPAASRGRRPSGAAMRQARDHLGGNWMRFYTLRIGRIAHHPDPRLGALDRQRARMDQPMFQLEARPADVDELGFDQNLVAKP